MNVAHTAFSSQLNKMQNKFCLSRVLRKNDGWFEAMYVLSEFPFFLANGNERRRTISQQKMVLYSTDPAISPGTCENVHGLAFLLY